MRMVFDSYGQKCYKSYADAATLLLRFLKYKKPHDVKSNINPIAHTDKSFISFLHQNNVRGLEVMTKDGEWFTFEPSPSSFMIMAGDAFVAWSNGRIKACYHRVAVREENEVRYSLGVFSYQKGMIKTPDELIDEERPQQFKPFDHVDFLCYRDSSDNRVKAQSLIKTYWGV
ncbi:probable 2-oxoglutarate-dependent dioxygenase AOP1.2 [Punica granatum]|nr:probable 2-oxoglutarate-dependent dioxygenase AOP1.2 [Punica granatum]